MAAKTMNMPFWRVEEHRDLAALNAAMEDELL